MVFTEILIVLFVLFFIFALINEISFRKFKIIDELPGPFSLPIIGNTFSFGYDLVDIFNTLNKFHERFGGVVRLWTLYAEPVVITNDADVIGDLISSTKYLDKSYAYDFMKPWLGTGLLTSTGSKWHKRRKLITPAFHFKVLEEFIEVFSRQTDNLVEKLREHVDQPSVNIYSYINKCSLDIIAKTAMGVNLNTQTGKSQEYLNAVKDILEICANRIFSILKSKDFTFSLTPDYYRMKRVVKILHDFTHSVIIQRRNILKKDAEEKVVDVLKKNRRMAFLDLLILAEEDGKKLPDKDIQEEVDTFLFEGFDTVSSALCYTLYELSRNSHIQDKVVEELRMVLGENFEEEVSAQNLGQMKYLGQVIKEGLRLYPSVPVTQRRLREDLKTGKYTLPKGTTMIINSYSLHRQEKHFKNPLEFLPERFDDGLPGKHPFCYIPFSGGPRNCVGQRFAMNEMKVVIAKILTRLRICPAEPKHELVLYSDGILKSNNGICMKFVER